MFSKPIYYADNAENLKDQVEFCRKDLDNILKKIEESDVYYSLFTKKFEKYFKDFLLLYKKFLASRPLVWYSIKALPPERLKTYSELFQPTSETIRDSLKRLVVVKLNGGLGTTMGCKGPKSLITVRNGMNFIDLTLQQLNNINKKFECSVPLVLMNSFSTDMDTRRSLYKYSGYNTKIYTFMQSQYPRINNDTLLPICTEETLKEGTCWYPPGHGDFYRSFYDSELLQKFLDEGRDIAFISNVDNLGATVDLSLNLTKLEILNLMTKTEPQTLAPDFVIEVTDKTKADVKGGTLIEYDERIRLLEIAQVPKENVEDFKNITTFKVFNTNNIWINLNSMKEKISNGHFEMDVITNRKTIHNFESIIQLETAIGAAVVNFEQSIGLLANLIAGLNVPRSRFLPVKNNSDLLLVMSNLYLLQDGNLTMNPKRMIKSTPIVHLSGPYFRSVKDFLARFQSTPDILELDYLAVSGDVCFDKNVTVKGTVIVLAQHGDHIDIPRCSVLENKIISGNLRILDH